MWPVTLASGGGDRPGEVWVVFQGPWRTSGDPKQEVLLGCHSCPAVDSVPFLTPSPARYLQMGKLRPRESVTWQRLHSSTGVVMGLGNQSLPELSSASHAGDPRFALGCLLCQCP